jgi:hypothetical protein
MVVTEDSGRYSEVAVSSSLKVHLKYSETRL